MKLLDVWVNCPSQEVAETISSELLVRRLVACSNIYPKITSSYHWKDRIESEDEFPLLLKTRDSLFDEVSAVVCDLHPYETPGIIAVPIERVNIDYQEWLVKETSEPGQAS